MLPSSRELPGRRCAKKIGKTREQRLAISFDLHAREATRASCCTASTSRCSRARWPTVSPSHRAIPASSGCMTPRTASGHARKKCTPKSGTRRKTCGTIPTPASTAHGPASISRRPWRGCSAWPKSNTPGSQRRPGRHGPFRSTSQHDQPQTNLAHSCGGSMEDVENKGRRLTCPEACALLGYRKSHFSDLVKTGVLPAHRHGKI